MHTPPGDERKMSWDDLPGLFPQFTGPGRWISRLQRHAELVAEAAPRVRVSAVGEDDIVRRHYAESLELLRIVLLNGSIAGVADVGSGGGFPGMVIACLLDDTPVHLVDSLGKRAKLLVELADSLGLPNVHVHACRAEDAGRGELRDAMAVVTARAVAPLRELLEYTAPLATPGGMLFFPKGSGLNDELTGAGQALRELNCEPRGRVAMRPEISETVSVLRIAKVGPTPERYPRRAGMPAKRPL